MGKIMDIFGAVWGNGKTMTNGSTLVVALVLVYAKSKGVEVSEAEVLAGLAGFWTTVGVIAKFVRG